MPTKPPTVEELARIADSLRLGLSARDVESFHRLLEPTVRGYARLDQLQEPVPVVRYPRDGGHRPEPGDNPLNAWYWRCDIKGSSEGLLKGKTFAVKDNVGVAGIPMMNGSRLLEGFVADIDATVVTRILDAGGALLANRSAKTCVFPAAAIPPTTDR
jgi:amidase